MEKVNWNQFLEASDKHFDPEEFGKLKAETINTTRGYLKGYDCPKCLNRGMYAVPNGDGVVIHECVCMKARRGLIRLEQSGLKKVIDELTFDNFCTSEGWQQRIKQGAMDFAAKPEGWLLFCGQVGCGKTHLCTAVCRQLLLDGCEVRYAPWRDEIAQLKALSLDSERRGALIRELKWSQVLYIDDFFKSGKGIDGLNNPTRADIDLAFEIINFRYMNDRTTIISTEKSANELISIDEAIASRIIKKAGKNIFQIKRNPSRNYRLKGIVEF